MRVALISDSHGTLPPLLFDRLDGCDAILHLGDLGPARLLTELAAIAPVHAVMGNTDAPGQPELPPRRRIRLDGLPVHLRHEPWSPGEVGEIEGLYLHGHIHCPRLERHGRAWICCPGALVRPRGSEAAYGLLDVDERRMSIAIHALDDERLLQREAWPRG